MTHLLAPSLMLAVLTAPLLSILLLSIRNTRSAGVWLLPGAAMPGLLVASLVPDGSFGLPGTLLGSALTLDAMTRVLLATSTLLWLAASVLIADRLSRNPTQWRQGVLAALALLGSSVLVMADDGLLWLAAGTLSGYTLYGLIVRDAARAGRAAGKRLIILLVLTDLVLFELFLLLAHAAEDTAFESMRGAIIHYEQPALILVLLTIGLGAKAAAAGLHAWLLPAVQASRPPARLLLLNFVLTAGLIGWLRLLPWGGIVWSGQGIALQWFALATSLLALVLGLAAITRGRLLGGLIMGLTGQWLWTLAIALQTSGSSQVFVETMTATALQTTLGLAVFVLVLEPVGRAPLDRLRRVLCWTAAGLIMFTPMAISGIWAGANAIGLAGLAWPYLAISLLVGEAMAWSAPRDLPPGRGSAALPRIPVATGLTLAALLWILLPVFSSGPAPDWFWTPWLERNWGTNKTLALSFIPLLFLVGWGITRSRRPWARTAGLARARHRFETRHALRRRIHTGLYRFFHTDLPVWRDGLYAHLSSLAMPWLWRSPLRWAERWLMRWESALILAVSIGLTASWLAMDT